MKRTFISTPVFDRCWEELGLADDDLRRLEYSIMENLFSGDIIVGTGGAVKIRFAAPGKGKSGSFRVIYTDVSHKERVYLLLCYAKSKQDDLSVEQKQQLKPLIKILRGESQNG